jgi:hypothetical protein
VPSARLLNLEAGVAERGDTLDHAVEEVCAASRQTARSCHYPVDDVCVICHGSISCQVAGRRATVCNRNVPLAPENAYSGAVVAPAVSLTSSAM